jgi:hypothetical protein
MRWPVFAAIVPHRAARRPAAGAGAERHRDEPVARRRPGAGRRACWRPSARLRCSCSTRCWRRSLRADPALELRAAHQRAARRALRRAPCAWAEHTRAVAAHAAVVLRIFLFFLQATALMALLPLVARQLHGGGPGTFTLMLSCVGGGAIVAALCFPRWRARFDRDQFVRLRHAGARGAVGCWSCWRPKSGWRCRPWWWRAWPGSRWPTR